MKAREILRERTDARTEIENMATVLPGDVSEYFVRFTDTDKIGFSARQHFGRTPDVDDPRFRAGELGQRQGRPAIWFYPLQTYLRNRDLFADDQPYTWLVRLKPNAWLQRVGREDKQQAPPGRQRVGLLRYDLGVPIAVFFEPAFTVIDRWEKNPQRRVAA